MKDPYGDEPTPYDDLPEVNSYEEIPALRMRTKSTNFGALTHSETGS
jgi:hypothetical protein